MSSRSRHKKTFGGNAGQGFVLRTDLLGSKCQNRANGQRTEAVWIGKRATAFVTKSTTRRHEGHDSKIPENVWGLRDARTKQKKHAKTHTTAHLELPPPRSRPPPPPLTPPPPPPRRCLAFFRSPWSITYGILGSVGAWWYQQHHAYGIKAGAERATARSTQQAATSRARPKACFWPEHEGGTRAQGWVGGLEEEQILKWSVTRKRGAARQDRHATETRGIHPYT